MNGNKIILHKKNGEVSEVNRIKGLNIRFKGKNSIVKIWELFRFRRNFGALRCKFRIEGDNNHIKICSGMDVVSLQIISVANNNKITLGENLFSSGLLLIEFSEESNLEFFCRKRLYVWTKC